MACPWPWPDGKGGDTANDICNRDDAATRNRDVVSVLRRLRRLALMGAYYNENDPYAAAWLRNLISKGLIAYGDVDDRDIRDVRPDDLRDYQQCHFFAGIGAWSYALRLAGWPDDQPVWTGSCPCQPFSTAGKQEGTGDERHIWPVLSDLIAECRPANVFGEQVASNLGRDWLASVRDDLEAMGYAVGAADLCAAGVGAPHVRQRLYWGAQRIEVAGGERRDQRRAGPAGGMGNTDNTGPQGWGSGRHRADKWALGAPGVAGGTSSTLVRLEHATSDGRQQRRSEPSGRFAISGRGQGFWSDCDWIECSDGKARPAQPGTFPLAHGITARVGRLRAYGNAIVPQVAANFVKAFLETCSNPGGLAQ